MDSLTSFITSYFVFVFIIVFMIVVSFITFICISVRLRCIRNSLENISDTFEEFSKKINQINIEYKK